MTVLSRNLKAYLERAGVARADLFASDATRKAMTFHDLRATGITWCAVRGDDPLKIKQRAGHGAFTTTELYVREADAVRVGFGTVFPVLPRCLLGIVPKSSRYDSKRIVAWKNKAIGVAPPGVEPGRPYGP